METSRQIEGRQGGRRPHPAQVAEQTGIARRQYIPLRTGARMGMANSGPCVWPWVSARTISLACPTGWVGPADAGDVVQGRPPF